MRIRISWDNGAVEAILDATPTAEKVWAVLPCTSTANTWGEEVYFEVPVQAELVPQMKKVVGRQIQGQDHLSGRKGVSRLRPLTRDPAAVVLLGTVGQGQLEYERGDQFPDLKHAFWP